MRSITAKYASRCKKCGGTIMQGTEAFYEDDSKKIYHPACSPQEQPAVDTAESHRVADSLGFLVHRIAMDVDWGNLCELPRTAGSPAAGRSEPEARGQQDSLFGMPETQDPS